VTAITLNFFLRFFLRLGLQAWPFSLDTAKLNR